MSNYVSVSYTYVHSHFKIFNVFFIDISSRIEIRAAIRKVRKNLIELKFGKYNKKIQEFNELQV
jgi:hypothetical protein